MVIHKNLMTEKPLPGYLLELLADYREFNPQCISQVVRTIPSSLEFSKAVARGVPLKYRAFERSESNAVSIDPCMSKQRAFEWSRKDLEALTGDLAIAVTPNGRADDLHHVEGFTSPVFLEPAEVSMSMKEFMLKLDTDEANAAGLPVYYLQSQNSNLTSTALKPLLKHIAESFPFASDVLGDPDAINLWIGNEKSVTSTHRDPYENLYLVIRGTKIFHLFPPVDELVLPTELVHTGKYVFDSNSTTFTIEVDDQHDGRIPWVAVDILQPRPHLIERFPNYSHTTPRVVTVQEGEILYLPNGWYHHVQQRCGTWDDGTRSPCIAINYWFDPDYEGEKYSMRQLITRLTASLKETEATNPEISSW